eukprot:1988546-Pleurochrysis_carterae.AAC.1
MPLGDRILWMGRDNRLGEGGAHVHDDARTHARRQRRGFRTHLQSVELGEESSDAFKLLSFHSGVHNTTAVFYF